jgi:hypothetical protein
MPADGFRDLYDDIGPAMASDRYRLTIGHGNAVTFNAYGTLGELDVLLDELRLQLEVIRQPELRDAENENTACLGHVPKEPCAAQTVCVRCDQPYPCEVRRMWILLGQSQACTRTLEGELTAERQRSAMTWQAAWEIHKHDAARAVHNVWMQGKLEDGFADHPFGGISPQWVGHFSPEYEPCRLCGTTRSLHHAGMVPFEDLTPEAQAYDYATAETVFKIAYEHGRADEVQHRRSRSIVSDEREPSAQAKAVLDVLEKAGWTIRPEQAADDLWTVAVLEHADRTGHFFFTLGTTRVDAIEKIADRILTQRHASARLNALMGSVKP